MSHTNLLQYKIGSTIEIISPTSLVKGIVRGLHDDFLIVDVKFDFDETVIRRIKFECVRIPKNV